MNTAIRWSSNSSLSEQRFLLADVAGRSFKHAKVTSYNGKSLDYEIISTYPKVPQFRAFDWASFDENLVAVGQWSGEATILRIDDTAPPLSLPTKHQRLCNAVTFSKAGLLATGLERVRNVECLNLWDINQRLSGTSSPTARSGKGFEPYRKFSSSGAISSIKFSIRTPEILIAGVKGFGIRIYDLRENSGHASSQFQTSCVSNVAIDPMNEFYFACCATGKDTAIQVWDCRSGSPHTAPGYGANSEPSHQNSPVLEYTETFTTSKNAAVPKTWSSKFCKGTSGFLGALASNGNFKVFETTIARPARNISAQVAQTQSSAERMLTKRVHEVEGPFDDPRQPREEADRIVAFDFTNLAGARGTPSAIVLRGNGSVSIKELSGPPLAFSLSACGALSVSRKPNRSTSASSNLAGNETDFDEVHTYLPNRGDAYTTVSASHDATTTLRRQITDENSSSKEIDGKKMLLSSHALHERVINSIGTGSTRDTLELITRSRRRCAARYNLDPLKNIDIIRDDEWLQTMWVWIERAKSNKSGEGMVAAGFDLSYLGVFDIWRSESTSDQDDKRHTPWEVATDLSDAVVARSGTLEQAFPEWEADSQEYRVVCLHTCGLGLPPEQLEATVKGMVDNAEKVKAAALAIFHNNGKLAIEALQSGKVSALDRELSLALAAYLNDLIDDGNETWSQTIQGLATDLTDPYARSILAIVSRGDWRDVLQETSLPLSDRVGIALMHLPDDELTNYINTTTEAAIESGDIEGLVLTGLGPKAVPLFENYIQKFSDLQTAVLAFAFTEPRYFTDPRVKAWRTTYRHQLNQLNMFIERAHYDTVHAQLSLAPDGSSTITPKPRQITLCCAYCNNALDRNPDNDPKDENPKATHGFRRGSNFSIAGKSGTSCPKCGRSMPRCAVCLRCIGTPDPYTKGSLAANQTFHEAFDNFTSVCLTCWHVTHVGHGEEWFSHHAVCPATGCKCRCQEVARGYA